MWLKSLSESILQLDAENKKHEFSIALEAIKSRNEIVKYQVGWAHDTCIALVDLSLEVAIVVENYLSSDKFEDASYKDVKRYIYNELNAHYYWKLRKLRSRFEMSNDLLAGYSHISLKILLNQDVLSKIFKSSGKGSKARVLKTYKNIWLYISELHCALLRISCNTPLFYLSEAGYNKRSEDLAGFEIEKYIEYLKKGEDSEYGFLLEVFNNVNLFFTPKPLDFQSFENTYPYKNE